MRTDGISPKVWVPVLLQAVAGVILLVVGFDVEGKTLIATAVGTFVTGFKSPPGDVVPEDLDWDTAAGDVRPPT